MQNYAQTAAALFESDTYQQGFFKRLAADIQNMIEQYGLARNLLKLEELPQGSPAPVLDGEHTNLIKDQKQGSYRVTLESGTRVIEGVVIARPFIVQNQYSTATKLWPLFHQALRDTLGCEDAQFRDHVRLMANHADSLTYGDYASLFGDKGIGTRNWMVVYDQECANALRHMAGVADGTRCFELDSTQIRVPYHNSDDSELIALSGMSTSGRCWTRSGYHAHCIDISVEFTPGRGAVLYDSLAMAIVGDVTAHYKK